MGDFWGAVWGIIKWPCRAALIVVSHSLPIFAFIGVYFLIEQTLFAIWGENEPMMVPGVPLKYLFRAIEIAIFVAFAYTGTVAAIRELKKG